MKLISVELFYRIYYALLTSCCLFCFVYINHAIQYEVNNAYFANYYQACEFDFDQQLTCVEPCVTNYYVLNKSNNDAKAWSFLSITINNYFFSYDLKMQNLNKCAMRNLFTYIFVVMCFQMHGFVCAGLLTNQRLQYNVVLQFLSLTVLIIFAFVNNILNSFNSLLLEQLDSELIVVC